MLVFTALSMTILVGFLAIAVDVGLLFRTKRNLQMAADSAATAAALDYYYNYTVQGSSAVSHAQAVGQTAATSNGFTDGSGGATVTINCPPTAGPEVSTKCNGFFEAILSQSQTNIFTSFFGQASHSSAALNSITVAARGVAGSPAASSDCIWLVNPTASGELTMKGGANSQLNANGCSVYLNSSSTTAVSFTGNPSVTVQALNLHSTQDVTKGIKKMTGAINAGVAPESPPVPTDFAGASVPGGCSTTDSASSTISSSYTPAGSGASATSPLVVCFTKAITISGGTSGSPINFAGMAYDPNSYTSQGVIYVFENGLTIGTGAWVNFGSATYTAPTGSATIGTYSNTSGATIDMEGGAFNIQSGQANLSIYAPTSGNYNGIAIMQPSGNTSSSSDNTCSGTSCLSVQFGSSNTNFDGMIFDPGGMVSMHDAGGGVTASGLIAGTVNVATSSLTINNYSLANPNTTPLKQVQLTE